LTCCVSRRFSVIAASIAVLGVSSFVGFTRGFVPHREKGV